MTRPERMCYVSLICKRDDVGKVIDILAKAKTIHIVDHEKETVGDVVVDQGIQRGDASSLSATLVRGHNLAAKLAHFNIANGAVRYAKNEYAKDEYVKDGYVKDGYVKGECVKGEYTKHDDCAKYFSDVSTTDEMTVTKMMMVIDNIASDFAELEDRLRVVDGELESNAALDKNLAVLKGLDTPLEELFGSERFKALVFEKNVEFDEQSITKIISKSELDNSIVVIVDDKDVASIKASHNANMLDVSRMNGMKGTVDEKLNDIAQRRRSLLESRYKLLLSQASFSKLLPQIKRTNWLLSLELMKAQAPSRFGMTGKLAIIQGFVPKKRTEDVVQALNDASILHTIEFADAHDAPVMLDNPRHASDFEMLIKMYGLPRYDEIDPTSMMAFTFPVFFGFMLGDIGYGLAALALFFGLGKWLPKIKPFCNIMMLSAISAAVFGLLFGEIFGMTSILGMALPSVIHRETDIMTMLGIAIIIGVIHINIGLLVGIVNESRDGWLRAVMKKGGFIGLQAGAFMMLLAYGALDSVPVISGLHTGRYAAWVVLLASIIAIVYAERVKGVLELPLVFSNMLSYTRLVALGLSSVFLAAVVNKMAGGLFEKGGFWIAAALILLIIGHTLNLVLGLLGPFMHSLRLHYVEFFSKFYEGGGKPFVAFGEVADGV